MNDTEEIKDLKLKVISLEADLIHAQRISVAELRTSGPVSFIDRHGILGLMFAIFIQTAGAVWWASGLTSQVEALNKASEQRDAVMQVMANTLQQNAERLTRVQTVQESVVKILDRYQTEFNRRGP